MNLKQIKPIHVKLVVVLMITTFTVTMAWLGREQAKEVAATADRAKQHNQSFFTLTVKYNNPDYIRTRVVWPLTMIFWAQILQAVLLLSPMKWPLSETEEAKATAVTANA
jgi:hypothetical protein